MRIGEFAAANGTTTKTLRFYEDAGLLPAPQRTSSGYRAYSPETVHRLEFIRRGRAAGLTLAQIREILGVRDAGTAPCEYVRQLLSTRLTDLDQQIADLQALRATVEELLSAAATVEPTTCDARSVCRYL